MRPWPEKLKQSLRHLAAARYFLPIKLNQGDFPQTEEVYANYLHHTEFELALDQLEYLGEQHVGDEFQSLFWSELLLAAEHMGLTENAARYRRHLEQLGNVPPNGL